MRRVVRSAAVMASAGILGACTSRLDLLPIGPPARIQARVERYRPGFKAVVATWSGVEGAVGYAVYLSTSDAFEKASTRRIEVPTPYAWIDDDGDDQNSLLDDTDYYLRVTSLRGSSESPPSFAVAVKTPPAGLFRPPVTLGVGANDGDEFGYAVASVGDFNGDRIDDVAAGAPGFSGDTGTVTLYLGGRPGSHGSVILGSGTGGGRYGEALAGADVNCDGFADVAVGEPDYQESTRGGRVYVWGGNDDGNGSYPFTKELGFPFEENHPGARFGAAITAYEADRIDNTDGCGDLAIGAPGEDDGAMADAGWAGVYLGNELVDSIKLAWFERGSEAGAAFGSSVARLGRLPVWTNGDHEEGDEIEDLAVGAPGNDGAGIVGRAYLFAGQGPAVGTTSAEFAAPIVLEDLDPAGNPNIDTGFGAAIAPFVTDYGTAVVAVGAPRFEGPFGDGTLSQLTNGGMTHFFRTSDERYGYAPLVTVLPNDELEAGAAIGGALASGDLTGDGRSEIVAGVPEHDFEGLSERGAAAVLYSGGENPEVYDREAIRGGAGDQRLGRSVALVDFDADGLLDLIVGSPGFESDRGRVDLYRTIPSQGPSVDAGVEVDAGVGQGFAPAGATFADGARADRYACTWTFEDGALAPTTISPCTPETAGAVVFAPAAAGTYALRLRVRAFADADDTTPRIAEAVTVVRVRE